MRRRHSQHLFEGDASRPGQLDPDALEQSGAESALYAICRDIVDDTIYEPVDTTRADFVDTRSNELRQNIHNAQIANTPTGQLLAMPGFFPTMFGALYDRLHACARPTYLKNEHYGDWAICNVDAAVEAFKKLFYGNNVPREEGLIDKIETDLSRRDQKKVIPRRMFDAILQGDADSEGLLNWLDTELEYHVSDHDVLIRALYGMSTSDFAAVRADFQTITGRELSPAFIDALERLFAEVGRHAAPDMRKLMIAAEGSTEPAYIAGFRVRNNLIRQAGLDRDWDENVVGYYAQQIQGMAKYFRENDSPEQIAQATKLDLRAAREIHQKYQVLKARGINLLDTLNKPSPASVLVRFEPAILPFIEAYLTWTGLPREMQGMLTDEAVRTIGEELQDELKPICADHLFAERQSANPVWVRDIERSIQIMENLGYGDVARAMYKAARLAPIMAKALQDYRRHAQRRR